MATSRRRTTIRPVTRELVLKAKDGDDPVAVFSSSGKLLGIVKPGDITPVADPDTDASEEARPKPTRSTQAEAAAGEDPEMGIAKARAAAREIKRGLYAGGTVADREKLATAMNAAAIQVEKQIHSRGPRRRS